MEGGNFKLITKAEFAEKIGISATTRHRLLNVIYYEKILLLGYRKNVHFLTAPVLKFLYTELCYSEKAD